MVIAWTLWPFYGEPAILKLWGLAIVCSRLRGKALGLDDVAGDSRSRPDNGSKTGVVWGLPFPAVIYIFMNQAIPAPIEQALLPF